MLCADNDPFVLSSLHAQLAGEPAVGVIGHNVRDPVGILHDPAVAGLIDHGEPAAIILGAVLHHVEDEADPWSIAGALTDAMAPGSGPGLEIVHIRFPDAGTRPLAGCEAGTIIYVFAAGEVTVCPYLVFAARTPQSRHDPAEFIAGNIFTDPDIARKLDAFGFAERYPMGANPTCRSCGIAGHCGKGCPAAVVAAGERIGAVDAGACPVTSGIRRLLPLAPA